MNGYFAMFYPKVFMFTYIFVFFSTYNRIIAAPSPFVLKLTHSIHILTPENKPNATIFEKIERAVESSMDRYAYLNSKVMQDSNTDVIQPGLMPGSFGTGFFANFSIGDPPISQMVLIDTGSGLTWIQCIPCVHCFSQPYPYYDPSKSSSFSSVKKDSASCYYRQTPSYNGTCMYDQVYADGSSTKGEIAEEKFTFTTSDEGLTTIPNLLFGCGHENYARVPIYGTLGLDATLISFVTQLGSKFSYCINSLSNPNYNYNQLVIGEGAVFEGDNTPIEIIGGKYLLTLESISFGNEKLKIDPSVFRRSREGKGGVIIDSGTFATILVRSAYDALVEQVEEWNFGRLPRVDYVKSFKLCYKGVMAQDLNDFPVVTFQFSGAPIRLRHENMFVQMSRDVFCLAFNPAGQYDLSIIGVVFQQYSNVGYDIAYRRLYFAPMDCEALVT